MIICLIETVRRCRVSGPGVLRFRGRDTIFIAVFSTLLVTAPVVLVPLFLVVHRLGLLNSYAGLIIPAIFSAFGIFLLRQFYLSIPRSSRKRQFSTAAGTG